MEINLFEIIAMVVNFFVLLFILQKFFYKPIQNVMEERQAKIDGLMEESLAKRKEADALIEEYKDKMASLATQEQVAMRQAREQAEEAREALFVEYKIEAEKRREALMKEIEDDKRALERDIQTVLGKNSVILASNILSYITDEALEEKLFYVFLESLKNLDPEKQKDLFASKSGKLELISANPLSKEKKGILEDVLAHIFPNYNQVTYAVDGSLVLGFELKMESYLIRISIKKYLEQMEMNILKTIDARF
ncbi:F0F1 ATP synthase subunit delta [Alkalibacter rhizosphaerae]|uniref:ATP synthase subunit b n=1 Tax=Alkalibacter rhizosphaerae TaxID=2815577 RepID=A0A974XET9_9FIRM|nr:F0F1 ATP synthase subunit delta [Alkalibacter rhizosphaerae]QSX08537.1 F0F1 ATP synthase subunit delta [Alkalibacter rhizosphaerae]